MALERPRLTEMGNEGASLSEKSSDAKLIVDIGPHRLLAAELRD